ncbi:MAG: rhomboid family intramembrane serine protease [Candidatus Bathyarchaeia archaeon]
MLIIACIFTSLLSWYGGTDIIFDYLAFSGENLLRGRVWTLVTALFLHGDLWHLLGNMVFLFVFGNTLEEELKAARTLTAFGGALSFLLSTLFFDPATPMIGASAAVFTLTAIAMLLKPLKFSFLFFMPLGLVAILYFLYNAAAVHFGVQGNTAYISHLIGFIVGIPFGVAWSRRWALNLLITVGLLLIYLFLIQFLLPDILGSISIP